MWGRGGGYTLPLTVTGAVFSSIIPELTARVAQRVSDEISRKSPNIMTDPL